MKAKPYFDQKIYLAQVDLNDQILGQVERWEAHKSGVLHRGFTAIIYFENQIILQHRKHPAFDGYWDLTFSSHQVYQNDILKPDESAVKVALNREWHLTESEIQGQLKFLGKIYYQAKDPNSIYTEHEIDYIFELKVKRLPVFNPEYAYGMDVMSGSVFNIINRNYKFAPWIETIIKQIKL